MASHETHRPFVDRLNIFFDSASARLTIRERAGDLRVMFRCVDKASGFLVFGVKRPRRGVVFVVLRLLVSF